MHWSKIQEPGKSFSLGELDELSMVLSLWYFWPVRSGNLV